MPAIRIALLNITEGGISGGYRKYLRSIIPHIVSDKRVSALMVGMPPGIALPEQEDIQVIQWLRMGINRFSPDRISAGTYEAVRDFKPDIIFVPTARYFKGGNIPVMNMIRNMEPLTGNYGNPLLERFKNILRAWEARRSTVKADRVIAVSGFVRDYVTREWGVSGDRVGVVYHGIKQNDAADGVKPPLLDAAWQGRFLFVAGSIRPARGLEDILGAYKLMMERDKEAAGGIVVAGEATGGMSAFARKLREWTVRNGMDGRIFWAGLLNDREMTWCYRNCLAFVMSSRVEACPNVVLEAMSNGCVSVSVDLPPMPEFFRDAALYYQAGDSVMLSKKLFEAAAMSEEKRRMLSGVALSYSRNFSWEKCAEKTVTECITAAEDGRARILR